MCRKATSTPALDDGQQMCLPGSMLRDVTCSRRVETAMVTARFQLRRRSLRRPAAFLVAGISLMAVCGCFLAVRVAAQNQGQNAILVAGNLVMIDTTVENKTPQITS